ncbi:MAG: SMC-Scp complex subunit ScpB [Pseudomonadota bacterium]
MSDSPAPPPPPPSPEEQERMVEAVLFASATPLAIPEIAERLPAGCAPEPAIERLRQHYAGRGVHLVRIGQAFAFRTAPDLAPVLQRETVEVRRLSRPALETLAIVAYHQPVTRIEIEEIRGVAVSRGTLDVLVELGWIGPGPRRQSPGRPATFVTTEAFLDHFGLETPGDLPGLDDLRAAGLVPAGQGQ